MTVTYRKESRTHCIRDQRILIDESLHSRTVNWVVVIIYSITRSFKTSASIRVVVTHKRYTLCKISSHSHIRHMNHCDSTSRTRAETKIADADYDNSRAYFSC